ncbi:long-chain-fatty-acid--CoA ligase [Fimbriiglobus ruber]|uniref:Long-chain-fatty-acid--CoA ligase n=1 Tax=Fimbriiglobus ruber TaxID=1908690 RepID=A0A225E160_9BACT|nr:long-chain fatty acid--CoA ligase [Fimbriiglobus ruber]OWK47301.1 Long-chain-fatty-acid--CoA ligase [Fimbriiglobus ruber]
MIALEHRALSERPWLSRYAAGVPHTLDYPAEPAYWLLERAAAMLPNRVACRYYEQQLTYAQLLDQARRAADALRRRGVKPGDRVGLLLPNVPEYLVAMFGTWMAGGIVVPLNPLMVAEEVALVLQSTGTRVVVTLDVTLPLVCSVKDAHPEVVLSISLRDRLPRWERLGYSFIRFQRVGLHSPCHKGHVADFGEALAEADPAAPIERPLPTDPAYIQPTGGTTGRPKAVLLTHRNLVANAWQLYHWTDQQFGEDVTLAILPFFHCYGLSTCALGGTARGATLVMHHRFRAATVMNLIERWRPTTFPVVPAIMVALNQELRRKHYDLHSLRDCISGGAPLDLAVAQEFARYTGATVVEGFGLSEASPVTHAGPLDGTARPGTIGLPLPDTDARVVDAETGLVEVPNGEVGELIIRGPQVMAGYWNDPVATAKTLRDGWLYTGDLARRDADGFFQIVDRKKDLIIVSGFNVYPTDVEHVLRRYSGLSDIVILGAPDERRGEVVKAVVVPAKGQRFNRAAFDAFAHEHLAAYKRPKIVEVAAELPRNPLGKVLRRVLRNQTVAPAIPAVANPLIEGGVA